MTKKKTVILLATTLLLFIGHRSHAQTGCVCYFAYTNGAWTTNGVTTSPWIYTNNSNTTENGFQVFENGSYTRLTATTHCGFQDPLVTTNGSQPCKIRGTSYTGIVVTVTAGACPLPLDTETWVLLIASALMALFYYRKQQLGAKANK